jgi:NADH dehydrogenase FAD-containing subunit
VRGERSKDVLIERYRFITGSRIAIPETGFPTETPFSVQLTNGTMLPSKYDFVILATGQTPNTELLNSLPTSSSSSEPTSLLNPENGFLRIRPTLQFQDEAYPHLFAVGDIADTGLRKAARPGAVQAGVVARNINALIRGEDKEKALEEFPRQPAGIHLSLGLVCFSPCFILFWVVWRGDN